MLLGLAAAEYWKRHRGETLTGGTPARLLAGFAALQVGATLLFVVAGSLWVAFAALWLRGVGNTLAEPVRAAWMNRSIEPRSRATVLSIESQANAFGQIGGGPALGWVANRTSIGVSLVGSAVLLTPTVALYARFARREATAGPVVIAKA
jgi:DHA3 family tetracycline resistance protein-like MFS transporter